MDYSKVNQINDAMTETLMPAIGIVSVYMAVGLIGNPMVIYYYGFRARSTSSFHFILALAVFDLIVCTVSMPLEIVDMTHFYKFESAVACKILRFVNYFATIGSGGILMALAVDRYRKICKPLRRQLTLQITRLIIGFVCLFSFCISWPSLAFYNIVSVNITKVPGLTGSDCTMIRDDDYKLLITVYNVFLFLIFLICVSALIILYSLVGKTLFRVKCCRLKRVAQKSENTGRRYSPAETVASEIESCNDSSKRNSVSYGLEIQIKDEHDDKPLATITELQIDNNNLSSSDHSHIEMSDVINQNIPSNDLPYCVEKDSKDSDDIDPSINRRSTEIILKEGSDGQTVAKLSNGKSHKIHKGKAKLTPNVSASSLGSIRYNHRSSRKSISRRLHTRQYTIMMIAITIAFIVSFLPYLALVTWRTIATDYEVDVLSDPELLAFQIFIRSFLISSAVNPLIYGFLNSEFRRFIYQRVCCCLNSKITSPDISSSHSI
ncbi:unnamed protein product [Mytilus coruscus]|uniref:G-protein coupled receptors family 1 profile domain-containing protein n=1 Tax=Mytilus coruscus TaxID=42192 RepID=A0A6J8B2J3_MYTCO|nr:unnamed protein product [Mytilus coruscus]